MQKQIQDLIKKNSIEFIDFQFCDLRGKSHHVTFPQEKFTDDLIKNGKVFDGSSIAGWCDIQNSDLIIIPELESHFIDPFCDAPTLSIRCNVFNPQTRQSYIRDPRAVATRAEQYIKNTGIADKCYFGQEVEFFIFDDVRWSNDIQGCFYALDVEEGVWNSGTKFKDGNMGHRPGIKGGYFPVPPVDSAHDLRSEMCKILKSVGLQPEAHHHEVATGNQNEIITKYNTLKNKADEMLTFKYVIHNVAHSFGKTATFMPKPLIGDNGSGMHCHQSLAKNGENLFYGTQYANLSELALFYVGGIMHHARALNAFANPGTNSYKRLIPGFEAPTSIAYSANNRSAGIRIPHSFTKSDARIEVRFPDALANSYLLFSAMLMAGIDGIKNRIHPGDAVDADIFHLDYERAKTIPKLCESLEEALAALLADKDFLLQGDVFSAEIIHAYVELKREEIMRLRQTTHPIEFDMYYSS